MMIEDIIRLYSSYFPQSCLVVVYEYRTRLLEEYAFSLIVLLVVLTIPDSVCLYLMENNMCDAYQRTTIIRTIKYAINNTRS